MFLEGIATASEDDGLVEGGYRLRCVPLNRNLPSQQEMVILKMGGEPVGRDGDRDSHVDTQERPPRVPGTPTTFTDELPSSSTLGLDDQSSADWASRFPTRVSTALVSCDRVFDPSFSPANPFSTNLLYEGLTPGNTTTLPRLSPYSLLNRMVGATPDGYSLRRTMCGK